MVKRKSCLASNEVFRVRILAGVLALGIASMVKRTSFQASNLEFQVQILVGALDDKEITTLEPDGQATGCNPVEVGSIPTGVSIDPKPQIASDLRESLGCQSFFTVVSHKIMRS